MERKDLTPSEEMLFNVYNNNHKTKIELEKVRNININNKKLIIEYFNENTLLGYSTATMDIALTDDEVAEYDNRKYHRAMELAAHAVHLDQSPFEDRFISAQDMSNLNYIYYNYDKVLENYVTFTVSEVSNGLVEVDTSYNNIFYAGDEVSFCDLKGDKHRLKFEWLVSPDFEYLKKYFTTYKKTKRREKIYKCQDDIETFKKLIAEREEELKQLENEED
jgi:hypothetical protein